jgi:hypothetical protein
MSLSAIHCPAARTRARTVCGADQGPRGGLEPWNVDAQIPDASFLPNGSFAQPTVLTNRIMQFVSDPAYSAPTPHLVPESDMSGESSRSTMVPIQPGDD